MILAWRFSPLPLPMSLQTHPLITLVPVTPDDADGLASLRVEAMRDSLERIGRFDPVRARERFLNGFVPAQTSGIHLDGALVGFLMLRREAPTWHLEHLYLHPAVQGRGIGSVVLQRLCAQADEAGAGIRLGALKQSDANRFYQRHGFEFSHEGEFDVYYLRPAARS